MHLSVPAGRQAGRAGAAVLYPQAAFLLLGPLEPVILWTGAQQKKGRVGELGEEWGASCLACCLSALEEESEAPAPYLCSRSNSQGGSRTSARTSVSHLRWLLPHQPLIWAEAPCHGLVGVRKKPECVCGWENVWGVCISLSPSSRLP